MLQFTSLESNVRVGSVVDSNLSKILTESYQNSKKVILVDENTNELCLPYLFMHIDGLGDAEIIELPAGEENKTMEICFSVWEALSEMELGRNDLLICLGGGVICDMGGFIASIFKRGMKCMYIPTSLLAMVDASVGGKTGVDLSAFKNQLGTFSPPAEVLIDATFLSTLPEQDKLNGLAEMLKHGLIADKKHFEIVSDLKMDGISDEIIRDSVQIKAAIVEQDPTEKGLRKLLNFGHTIGHAIEGFYLNTENQMDHGLAVAHGMLVEAKLSVMGAGFPESDFKALENVLRTKFTIRTFDAEAIEGFLELMRQDKKRVGDESRFTLLEEIGRGIYDVNVLDEIVLDAFQILR